MRELSLVARDYFEHPRHAGSLDSDRADVMTVQVDVPTSGEILRLQLRMDERGVIVEARFKAYGCGWLIACGSLLTERMTGLTLAEAGLLRHHEWVEQLTVPPEKLHCAVLAETALQTALGSLSPNPSPTRGEGNSG
jgi:nitrogen fixation NifU-like protein